MNRWGTRWVGCAMIDLTSAALLVLGLLLLVGSPTLRRRIAHDLAGWLFFASLVVSAIAGFFIGFPLAASGVRDNTGVVAGPYIPPAALAVFLLLPIVSVTTFVLLYEGVALPLMGAVEKKRGVRLEKPGLGAGMVWSAVCPFIVYAIMAAAKH